MDKTYDVIFFFLIASKLLWYKKKKTIQGVLLLKSNESWGDSSKSIHHTTPSWITFLLQHAPVCFIA